MGKGERMKGWPWEEVKMVVRDENVEVRKR
jgi:hypothetical protein